MKKIRYVIVLALVFFLAIVVLTTCFTSDFIEGIKLGTSIISSLATITAMIIALLLFDRFGLNKRFINYQTDSLIKLIELLRNSLCTIEGKHMHYIIPLAQDLKQRKELIIKENDQDKKLIFACSDENYHPLEDITQLINDYWMPDVIKRKMKFLELVGTYDKPPFDILPQNILKVNFGGRNSDKYVANYEINCIEFLENIEDLNKEISDWFSKNSTLKLGDDLRPIN
jgi:hypothetical protein